MQRVDEWKVGAVAGKGGFGREEIDKMGKAELVNLLVTMTKAYNLSNEGYSTIAFKNSPLVDGSEKPKPPCYPRSTRAGTTR